MKLDNWAIVDNSTPYIAPELIRKYAVGNVYGHSKYPDGHSIRTSSLVEINLKQRYVKTASGSKYKLGKMKPEYAAYRRSLKKEGK